MRAGNTLLIAGSVVVVAALSGSSLAAEDEGRTAPEAEVEAVAPGAADEPVDASGLGTPAPLDGDGRTPEEVETESAEKAENDPAAGDDKAKRGGGRKAKDREKRRRANVTVKMENIAFKPKSVTVSAGDEVTWRNLDTAQHDAVGQGNADFETPLLSKGETATVPFNRSGTFNYICTVHPSMTGKVVVRSQGSGGTGGGGAVSSANTGSGTGSTGSTFPSGSSSSSSFDSSGSSSRGGGGGTLPNTGGVELPLLLFGSGLIVLGLLARAFHEHWIWR